MVFNARTQRGLLVFILALTMLSMLITNSYMILYFYIVLTIFILIATFLQFQVKIADDSIYYEMNIFQFTIYKKELQPKQIVAMKCTRIGWAKKNVVVKTKKGFNLRINHFYPEKIYNNLIDYANEHHISIVKTKDYLILEKLN